MRHNLTICNYTKNIVPAIYSEFILEVGDSSEISQFLTADTLADFDWPTRVTRVTLKCVWFSVRTQYHESNPTEQR